MDKINKEDSERILKFIEYNHLPYYVADNEYKFIVSHPEGISFTIYFYENKYVIVSYDPKLDNGNVFINAYQYFYFDTVLQILEQLELYDQSIPKLDYYITLNSTEIGFDKNSYIKNWYDEFTKEVDNTKIINYNDQYMYIEYTNDILTPNIPESTAVKLYYEIHPITLTKNSEQYLFKVLINDDKIKDYRNYIAKRKIGLKNLIQVISYKNI